jgi:hypothetical protein
MPKEASEVLLYERYRMCSFMGVLDPFSIIACSLQIELSNLQTADGTVRTAVNLPHLAVLIEHDSISTALPCGTARCRPLSERCFSLLRSSFSTVSESCDSEDSKQDERRNGLILQPV